MVQRRKKTVMQCFAINAGTCVRFYIELHYIICLLVIKKKTYRNLPFYNRANVRPLQYACALNRVIELSFTTRALRHGGRARPGARYQDSQGEGLGAVLVRPGSQAGEVPAAPQNLGNEPKR